MEEIFFHVRQDRLISIPVLDQLYGVKSCIDDTVENVNIASPLAAEILNPYSIEMA